jgi:Lon protease-like protein
VIRGRALPASLPLFPLSGVLLLPRGQLPLNIFEPRYLAMTDDALAGDRMIGMIQPTVPDSPAQNPALYKVGCAGRITSFAEMGERYLITLTGISRFDLVEEMPTTRGYRRAVPDWTGYGEDLAESDLDLDRPRLLAGLERYFDRHGLKADWSAVNAAPSEKLVTLVAMLCPFSPAEKQALLESPDFDARGRLLIDLVEMDARPIQGDGLRH